MFVLEVKLTFDSAKTALRFFKSVAPEMNEEFLRSTTKISKTDSTLGIKITAQDKTALRASLNSFLKPLILFTQLEELK